METHLESLLRNMRPRPGALESEIMEIESALGVQLPPDYVEFLRASNGAEGGIGHSHVVLFSLERVKSISKTYDLPRYSPGLVPFGDDGAMMVYGFDMRQNTPTIIEVDYVCIGIEEDTRVHNMTFVKFLEYLSTRLTVE